MIHVIATIDVTAGRREEFLTAFKELVPKVKAEEGCIEYGPAIDTDSGIPAQQRKGDDVVTVIEKWDNVAALTAHLDAPHMREYREQVKDLVQGMTLHVLEPA